MGLLRHRISGVMTLEASYVVGIILLIIVYQTGFTLKLYERVKDYSKECAMEIKEMDCTESLRLSRFALKALGER